MDVLVVGVGVDVDVLVVGVGVDVVLVLVEVEVEIEVLVLVLVEVNVVVDVLLVLAGALVLVLVLMEVSKVDMEGGSDVVRGVVDVLATVVVTAVVAGAGHVGGVGPTPTAKYTVTLPTTGLPSPRPLSCAVI